MGTLKKLIMPALIVLLHGCSQESASPAVAPETEAPLNLPLAGDGVITVSTTGNLANLTEVLAAYRAETGVRSIVRKRQALQRGELLEQPELMPDVDLFVGTSMAEVWAVAEADELRPTFSAEINRNVPAHLLDPESRWAGLSVHARIVVYNPEIVSATEITTLQSYAGLGESVWRDRLCLSSSRLAGNRLLVAYLLHEHGLRETEIIVRQWRANFGTRIFAADADLLNAVVAGNCALGVVASSEYEKFIQVAPSDSVAPHWFEADNRLLVDFHAAGVSRHAADPDAAARLLEWLTSRDANALIAALEREVPANVEAITAAALSSGVERLRTTEAIPNLGFYQEDAGKLIERAKYP